MSDRIVQVQLAEPWFTLLFFSAVLVMLLAVLTFIYLVNKLLDAAAANPNIRFFGWREADDE